MALPSPAGAPGTTPRLHAAIHWTLRSALVLCFVGHGAIGIATKESWVPYFGLAGISPESAYRLMPVVGAADVLLGLLILLRPTRALLAYAAAWCLWTALVRPLSGEPIWELLERAANFGVPLALLAAAGASGGWHASIRPDRLDPAGLRRVRAILTATTTLLLLGHGAFGLVMQKPLLLRQLDAVDLMPAGVAPVQVLAAMGTFEILLALLVLLRPGWRLLLFVAAWKLATEMLYPLSGASAWELVERGASFGAPLALAAIAHLAARVPGAASCAAAAPAALRPAKSTLTAG